MAKELSGLKLFKFDVTKVLENTDDQPVNLSGQFPREFKRVFNEKFSVKKYGFENTDSFYAYFNRISDVVKFSKKNGKVAIALKKCVKGKTAGNDTVNYEHDENDSSGDDDERAESLDGLSETKLTKPEGIELFISHFMMILGDSETQSINLSDFKRFYKEKFHIKFHKKNYKIKGTMKTFIEQNMTDVVDIEQVGSTIYIKAKCSDDILDTSLTAPDDEIGGYYSHLIQDNILHDNSAQSSSRTTTSCAEMEGEASEQQRSIITRRVIGVRPLTPPTPYSCDGNDNVGDDGSSFGDDDTGDGYCDGNGDGSGDVAGNDSGSDDGNADSSGAVKSDNTFLSAKESQSLKELDPQQVVSIKPTKTEGTELLKSHVMEILDDSETQEINLCHFDRLYKEKFHITFKKKRYKIKGKLKAFLEKKMSNLVDIEPVGTAVYIKAKRNRGIHDSGFQVISNDDICGYYTPVSENVKPHHNSVQTSSKPVFSSAEREVVKIEKHVSVSSNIAQIQSQVHHCLPSHTRLTSSLVTCTPSINESSSNMQSQGVVVPSAQQSKCIPKRETLDDKESDQTSEPTSATSNRVCQEGIACTPAQHSKCTQKREALDDNQSDQTSEPTSTTSIRTRQEGLELWKSHAREVLRGKGKVLINKFQTLYQHKFKYNCRGGRYKHKGKKMGHMLRLIPDVVNVEVKGSDFFVELKDDEYLPKAIDNSVVSSSQNDDNEIDDATDDESSLPDPSKSQQSSQHQVNMISNQQNDIARTQPASQPSGTTFPKQGSQNWDDITPHEDQATYNNCVSESTATSEPSNTCDGLSGKELLSFEVRQVLLGLGKIELSHFSKAYRSKFGTDFNARKYKIKGSKKLQKLMEKIPNVVQITVEKHSQIFVELIDQNTRTTQSAVATPEPLESKLVPLPLETVSMTTKNVISPMIAVGESTPALPTQKILKQCQEALPLSGTLETVFMTTRSVTSPLIDLGESTPALPTQEMPKQCHETPSLSEDLKTPNRRRKAAKTQSDIVDNRLMFTPSPFEDSFQASQDTVPSSSHHKSRNMWTLQKLNELCKETIKGIAEGGNYVSLELVKATMCRVIGVKSLSEVGCGHPENDIPELKELKRLHAKLDLYGRAYVMVHSIATLTELEQSMARLLEKKDFAELNVGPLVKLPVVYDLFKAPSDDTVMQNMTTIQVLKHLENYLTKEDKWTSKVNLEHFIQFLCNKYRCESPYELGVRVQSVGLSISVLKRAKRAQSERSKEVEQQLVVDFENDFHRRCKKIKDDLFGTSHKDERSLLGKLLGDSKSVTEILTSIFNHCQPAFQNHHTVGKRDLANVQSFLKTLVGNKPLRDMFNVALHMGCKSVVSDILDDVKAEARDELEKEKEEKVKATKPPKKKELTKKVKDWCSGAEDLKLSTLAFIEDSVMDQYRQAFPNFASFGYGSFLEFVTKQPEIKKLLEERNALLGNVSLGARLHDMGVLDFVLQCGSSTPKESIEHAVRDHYHIKKLEDLGFGNLDNIISKARRRHQQHQTSVFYETALLSKGQSTVPSPPAIPESSLDYKAGLLGWKKPEDALKALKAAPLLTDLTEWTQWTLVYEPCLGDIKKFIDQDSNGDIQVLETGNKSLLRIDTNTTPDRFYEYVDQYDVSGTCGTLVSLVVKSGGIKEAPIALLVNHMRPALSKLAAMGQENDDGLTACSQFVLQCLCRLPQNMSIALADKVFLEPFGQVVGTRSSCSLLLSHCTDDNQRSTLHFLGLHLGKSDWVKDFESLTAGEEQRPQEKPKIIRSEELRPVAVVQPVKVEPSGDVVDTEESQDDSSEAESVSSSEEEEKDSSIDITDDCEEAGLSQAEDITSSPLPSDPCKAVIDTIRKEEFGIGVDLGEEEGKLVQKQREREGRSLQRLAAELYNRDTHFVLELVQNADDNSYPQATEQLPSLMFVVDDKKIVVLNNEVGFSEKNIRALCDVGKSTKGPHQYGYIGQKGIGFKSVFRISDKPEVHSNGYHIRFDAKSGPSGYILPHWIGQEGNQDDSVDDDQEDGSGDGYQDGWMTRIVLPLKDEFHSDKKTSLSARFHDVHPSLLLFLHRLRSIIIVKNNDVQRMTRFDHKDGIIEIQHGEDTNRWLVVKKQLTASNVREDVDKTELALAFPMTDEINNSTLPPQNVFAYLPLRSYGFKFIIQGDFEVPSSREDIDQDKAWNQWLREEIPKLFIDTLDVFKEHPSFPGLQAIVKFFQFVPLEEEILGFFRPVASTILKKLQGIPCLPVEKHLENEAGQDDSNRDPKEYDWMQPCTVVICDDPVVRSLITPYILHKYLNLYYIVHDVASTINPAMRAKLGIQTLSARHIIDIGQAVLADSTEHDVKWIAKWLHCIYCCLESEHNSSVQMLNDIASMKMIPLSDGSVVSLKDNAVFFPLSVEQSAKTKKKKSKASYLPVLERDLSVLHPELLSQLDEVAQSQVHKLLSRLGVKSWSPNDVIHNHILPTLKSQRWKEKSDKVLQSYVVYIFDQQMRDDGVCSLDEVKECCQVITNKGPLNPQSTPVHFTPKYGNKLDLKDQLPSINWTLLDNTYLELSMHNHLTSKDWRSFFSSLGVVDFLAIERKTTKLTQMNMSSSSWEAYHGNWPATSDGCYILDDYHCSELEEFMANEHKLNHTEAKVIAENLDQLWDTHYSKYADPIPVKDSEKRKLCATYSSFMVHLREKAWLPGWDASCHVPKNLYHDTDQFRALLDEHVKYAAVKLTNESFISSIGLVSSISVEDLLKHLRDWSSHSQNSEIEGFKTSLLHMRNVFAFLIDKCNSQPSKAKIITDAFVKSSLKLIFVPGELVQDPRKRVQGKFFSIKEVCWNDPSGVSRKLQQTKKYTPKRQLLSTHYKESDDHDFLKLVLKVDSTPHTDEYIEMAVVLVQENSVPTPAVIEDIIKIFAVLGDKCLSKSHQSNSNFYDVDESCNIDQNIAKYLKEKLKDEVIFPCGEKWVTLAEKPIICDDKQLKKIFEKEKEVHFISESPQVKKKPHAMKGSRLVDGKKVKVFMSACGITKLSEIVEEELQPESVEYQCYDTQMYFHKVVPYIQRYLYHRLEDQYSQLKDKSFGRILVDMKFATVKKLEVVYRLKGHNVAVPKEINYGCEKIAPMLHFYSKHHQSKSKDDLHKAVTKLFITDTGKSDFELFLQVLSSKLDDDDNELESFLEKHEAFALPDHEEVWIVPKPEAPASPEPQPLEDFLPPPVRRQKQREDDGGMPCWPPRSSASGKKINVQEHNPTKQRVDEMWPQPAAPESITKESQGLEGSRLSSYMAAPPTGQNTEKRTDSEAVVRKDIKSEPSQIHPKIAPTGVAPVENVATQVQQSVASSTDVQPSSGEGPMAENVVKPGETIVQSAAACSAVAPYPSDGTILPSSPASHLLVQSSTPQSGIGSPVVYSPRVPVTIEDLDFEEISQEHILRLSLNLSVNESPESSVNIGRLGEELVHEYLKKEQLTDGTEREIIWMNQEENSTAPFDIQVTEKDIHSGENVTVTYIEVKSTSTGDKEYFEISLPELCFALEQRQSFHLYRVYNVGNPNTRIVRLKNLAEHLDKKSVKLFVVI